MQQDKNKKIRDCVH